MKGIYAIMMLTAILCTGAAADTLRVANVGDSVIDSQALTLSEDPKTPWGMVINGQSFQQEAVISHRGYQYVGYYNTERHVCLARRQLPDGAWQIIRFTDYNFESNDCHNTISVGICPKDGTIHLAFDHHVSPLHYRVSRKGAATDPAAVKWDAALFGPVTSQLDGPTPGISYPRFIQTPEGSLQLCYRRGGSGDGSKFLVDYDPETGLWRDTRQILAPQGIYKEGEVASESRGPYINGIEYGPDGKLHVSWTWRELMWAENRDLCYAYSEDRGKTWKDTFGKVVRSPMSADSPLVVADIPRQRGLMNTQGQTVDSANRVHVIMWHSTADTLVDRVAEINKPFLATYQSVGAGNMLREWLNAKSVAVIGDPVTSDEGTTGKQGFSVGSYVGGDYIGWRGEIGEILVYDSALSDADRLKIEQYLKNRWLAPAPATAAVDALPVTTGLRLRLTAEKGVTASAEELVSAWADQSGNGFEAKQGIDDLKPRVNPNGINGHPSLTFSKDILCYTGGDIVKPGSARTVFIVARSDGSSHKYGPGWGGDLFSFQCAGTGMVLGQCAFYGTWVIYKDLAGKTSEKLGLAGTGGESGFGGWPGARRYHHYWREPGNGQWHHTELPWIAGSRPKVFADRENNLYMIYNAPVNLAALNEFKGGGLQGLFFSRGSLVIAGATAVSQWSDWRILHTEPGPFYNEMLGDRTRWREDGVLSVFVQNSPPGKPGTPTPLRMLDFRVSVSHDADVR